MNDYLGNCPSEKHVRKKKEQVPAGHSSGAKKAFLSQWRCSHHSCTEDY
jgi:hypothetical protein